MLEADGSLQGGGGEGGSWVITQGWHKRKNFQISGLQRLAFLCMYKSCVINCKAWCITNLYGILDRSFVRLFIRFCFFV